MSEETNLINFSPSWENKDHNYFIIKNINDIFVDDEKYLRYQ